jgi:P pilus assembly chaperone PapD
VASVNSLTFDQPAYSTGQTITLTVAYTPDAPAVVPTTFTATATITDSTGTVVATNDAPFVVNVAQASGDQVGVTDTGNRTWAETAGSDTGSSVVFTATA